MPVHMTEFEIWIRNFVEEKDLDIESFHIRCNNELHVIDNYDVLEIMITELDHKTQASVKKKIVQLDFMNGDINDFFRYIAEGYIQHMFTAPIGS